jgi:hypothetical protein
LEKNWKVKIKINNVSIWKHIYHQFSSVHHLSQSTGCNRMSISIERSFFLILKRINLLLFESRGLAIELRTVYVKNMPVRHVSQPFSQRLCTLKCQPPRQQTAWREIHYCFHHKIFSGSWFQLRTYIFIPSLYSSIISLSIHFTMIGEQQQYDTRTKTHLNLHINLSIYVCMCASLKEWNWNLKKKTANNCTKIENRTQCMQIIPKELNKLWWLSIYQNTGLFLLFCCTYLQSSSL